MIHIALHQPTTHLLLSPTTTSTDCLCSAPLPRPTRGRRLQCSRVAASDLPPLGKKRHALSYSWTRNGEEPEGNLSLFFAFPGRVRTPWACCISFVRRSRRLGKRKHPDRERSERWVCCWRKGQEAPRKNAWGEVILGLMILSSPGRWQLLRREAKYCLCTGKKDKSDSSPSGMHLQRCR